MKEEWRDIKGYEGLYQVSNLGRVKSLGFDKNHKGRILKPYTHKDGYKRVFLVNKNGKKYFTVHRIVGMAFVEGYAEGLCINHKNEIKTDNRADNLEWCTKAYNNTYNGKTQRCCKAIDQLTLDGDFVRTWKSAREVSKVLGIQWKNISAVCRGKRNKCGGFKWRFANE